MKKLLLFCAFAIISNCSFAQPGDPGGDPDQPPPPPPPPPVEDNFSYDEHKPKKKQKKTLWFDHNWYYVLYKNLILLRHR